MTPIKWGRRESFAAGLLMALMAGGAFIVLSPTLFGWTLPLIVALSLLAVCDWRFGRLLDIFTLPLILLGLLFQITQPLSSFMMALIGMVAGYGLVVLINYMYQHLRGRDGMGYGDAKLLAAAGAWLGWEGLPGLLLTASLAALVHVTVKIFLTGQKISRYQSIAFGPYLVLGFYAQWLLPLQHHI